MKHGLLAIWMMTLSLSALASDDYPETTPEGLHKVRDSRLGLVYADPEADFGIYEKIWLVQPTVAFRKNWQRDQNRYDPFKVRPQDMERIRSDLAG